jgi:ComF family protein
VIKNASNFAENISEIIFPPVCGICGKFDKNYLCKKCENILISEAKFKIDIVEEKNICFEHLYIFKYEGIIRKLLLDYKFNDKSYLFRTLSNFILNNKKFLNILKSYTTIVPVPISKKRNKDRGYNQSYLISNEISKKANLECNNNSLLKVRNIIEQSKLSKEERERNIKDAYKLKNKSDLENKKIILFDDIYTTGSTAIECYKTLIEANVEKISVMTIAKD